MTQLANPIAPHEFIMVYRGGMPLADYSLSLRMDMIECEQLCAGQLRIDQEIAEKLSDAYKTSPQFWLNLQSQYDAANPEIK